MPQEKRKQVQTIIRKDNLSITCDQAASLRHQLLQEKSVHCHHQLQGQRKTLLSKYSAGESIMALSRSHDFPPMALVRAILMEREWLSPKRLKDVLKNPQRFTRDQRSRFPGAKCVLDQRDVQQIAEAAENDIVTAVDQDESAANAELFEDFLCSYLERHQVQFIRQSEVAAQQMQKFGQAVATPDILFEQPIEINGQCTNWIDAKNFYGADLSMLKKRSIKQMDRYVKRWGAGAVVFSKGHCQALSLPGCTLFGVEFQQREEGGSEGDIKKIEKEERQQQRKKQKPKKQLREKLAEMEQQQQEEREQRPTTLLIKVRRRKFFSSTR
jgi:hypothetical protein